MNQRVLMIAAVLVIIALTITGCRKTDWFCPHHEYSIGGHCQKSGLFTR